MTKDEQAFLNRLRKALLEAAQEIDVYCGTSGLRKTNGLSNGDTKALFGRLIKKAINERITA